MYKGKNRRVHTCFITENREYHTKSGVCVAVRDKNSKVWIAGHWAIGMILKPLPPGAVFLGYPLEFLSKAQRVLTSHVVDILRPGRSTVNMYKCTLGFLPQ